MCFYKTFVFTQVKYFFLQALIVEADYLNPSGIGLAEPVTTILWTSLFPIFPYL